MTSSQSQVACNSHLEGPVTQILRYQAQMHYIPTMVLGTSYHHVWVLDPQGRNKVSTHPASASVAWTISCRKARTRQARLEENRLFPQVEGPFLGCPYDKIPTLLGPPDFWNIPNICEFHDKDTRPGAPLQKDDLALAQACARNVAPISPPRRWIISGC